MSFFNLRFLLLFLLVYSYFCQKQQQSSEGILWQIGQSYNDLNCLSSSFSYQESIPDIVQPNCIPHPCFNGYIVYCNASSPEAYLPIGEFFMETYFAPQTPDCPNQPQQMLFFPTRKCFIDNQSVIVVSKIITCNNPNTGVATMTTYTGKSCNGSVTTSTYPLNICVQGDYAFYNCISGSDGQLCSLNRLGATFIYLFLCLWVIIYST